MSKKFTPFKDMKESAKAQHKVDKAKFSAIKSEAKAKLSPKQKETLRNEKRQQEILEANEREKAAGARIQAAKK